MSIEPIVAPRVAPDKAACAVRRGFPVASCAVDAISPVPIKLPSRAPPNWFLSSASFSSSSVNAVKNTSFILRLYELNRSHRIKLSGHRLGYDHTVRVDTHLVGLDVAVFQVRSAIQTVTSVLEDHYQSKRDVEQL